MFDKALEDWIRPNTFAGYSHSPNINIVNSAGKKKPHNIQIDNNRKEPKVNANVKYSQKQNFRRYKTKIEPGLHSKIQINEEDDIVSKIKEAFGLKKPNTNYAEVETAPAGSMITNVEEAPYLGRRINRDKLNLDEIDGLANQDIKHYIKSQPYLDHDDAQYLQKSFGDKYAELGRDLHEDERLDLFRNYLKHYVTKKEQQKQSLDDITPEDQEELTSLAPRVAYFDPDIEEEEEEEEEDIGDLATSPISPARPHKAPIVKFPEAARPSLSHEELEKVGKLSPFVVAARTRAQTAFQKQRTAASIIARTYRNYEFGQAHKALTDEYKHSQNELKATIQNNKDKPQKSYRDILNEREVYEQKDRLAKERNAMLAEYNRKDAERRLSSAAASTNTTIEGEKRRGRPVGSFGPKKLERIAKKTERERQALVRQENQEREARKIIEARNERERQEDEKKAKGKKKKK